MKVTFWGATEDVTGSMTFVHMPEGLMVIDSGLAQGSAETEAMNEQRLPFKANEIKAMIITHAHLDHSGYIPLLVKHGFKGKIYCTKPTAGLVRIILRDSASLEDAYYDDGDVTAALNMVQTLEWHETKEILGGTVSFFPAGHILGASSVKIKAQEKTVIFSGDLGRKNDPLIPAPEVCPEADMVIMESTYGNKMRQGNAEKELHTFLMKISREKRIGIIASFAVARGQMLMTMINDFFERHPEERVRVVYDSPMMSEANDVYKSFSHLLKDPEALKSGLSHADSLEYDRQWESLRKKQGPFLIISSSGMLTGGRIGRHLMNWHDDENAVLFLPGYQGQGTPGRALLNGDHHLKYGDYSYTWKGEVIGSDAFSSHADQNELLEWTEKLQPKTRICLIHGEEKSKSEFAKKLTEKGFQVKIPFRSEQVTVS